MDNNLILVTGAASGIGMATCGALSMEGHRLACLDVDSKGLEKTVDDCNKRGGGAEGFLCDLTKDEQVASACMTIKERLGVVQTVVYCAGIGRYASFGDLQIDEWRRMVDVNLFGAVRLTKCLLPGMVELKSGKIILIGSRRGLEPARGTSAYSASKAALLAFAKGLALEVSEHNIQVCYLAPGGVKTDFGGVDRADKDPRYLAPEVVARSILHVISTPPGAWIRELTLLPLGL